MRAKLVYWVGIIVEGIFLHVAGPGLIPKSYMVPWSWQQCKTRSNPWTMLCGTNQPSKKLSLFTWMDLTSSSDVQPSFLCMYNATYSVSWCPVCNIKSCQWIFLGQYPYGSLMSQFYLVSGHGHMHRRDICKFWTCYWVPLSCTRWAHGWDFCVQPLVITWVSKPFCAWTFLIIWALPVPG